jgi:hypothetical protein
MRYQPEKLRGIPFHEQAYLEFGGKYYNLDSAQNGINLITFFENNIEHQFKIPDLVLSQLQSGNFMQPRLRWLTIIPVKIPAVGPRSQSPIDSDGLN